MQGCNPMLMSTTLNGFCSTSLHACLLALLSKLEGYVPEIECILKCVVTGVCCWWRGPCIYVALGGSAPVALFQGRTHFTALSVTFIHNLNTWLSTQWQLCSSHTWSCRAGWWQTGTGEAGN